MQKKADDLRAQFLEATNLHLSPSVKPKALYLIWRKPWMAAGGGTFINTIMDLLGLENIYANISRYPKVSLENLSPDFVLLPDEPYNFSQEECVFKIIYVPY